MTREKAKSLVSAFKHPANPRRWAVRLDIEQQGFVIDAGRPLTKREAGWWIERLTRALMKL